MKTSVQKTSNPSFLITIGFRGEHNITAKTEASLPNYHSLILASTFILLQQLSCVQVKICAQDLRERLTMTRTTLGNAFVTIEDLLAAGEE